MIIARSIHSPVCIKSLDNHDISTENLKDKKILAFCGIGNPNAFFNTVKGLNAKLIGIKIFNDHHHYTENEITDIHKQAKTSKADLILTTQKDWTKISLFLSKMQSLASDIQFAYLVVELRILAGEDKLKALINKTLAGIISKT